VIAEDAIGSREAMSEWVRLERYRRAVVGPAAAHAGR
jgi:hypothetical protein